MTSATDVARGIASRAVDKLEADGSTLAADLRHRLLEAGQALALAHLAELAGAGEMREARTVARARFDNLTAAGVQGTAQALVRNVRAALVEGLEVLVSSAL